MFPELLQGRPDEPRLGRTHGLIAGQRPGRSVVLSPE
jgi:hypothetical protein